MLTPQELTGKTFEKAVFGGYDMASVEEFIEAVAKDYTDLYKENAALKSKMKVLVDKVEEYRATEDSMRAALLAAQKQATAMVTEAEERKETLLADAELEARAKIGALHDEIINEQKRLNAIKTATKEFLANTRALCESELKVLEAAPDLTLEEIEQTTQEVRTAQAQAANIAALSEKILADYNKSVEKPAEQPAEGTAVFTPVNGAVPAEPQPQPVAQPQPVPQPQMAPQPVPQPQAAPQPQPQPVRTAFTNTDTRPVNLADLKFGRNYHAEDDL